MDEYEDLEQLLRQQLRLRDAPDGFGMRLSALLGERVSFKTRLTEAANWRTRLLPFAIASVLLATVSGSYWIREYKNRLAGEQARSQVLLALRITANTLSNVQHKVTKEH